MLPPDARSSRHLPHRPYAAPPSRPMPAADTSYIPTPPTAPNFPPNGARTLISPSREHAIDFATHSWDLATGGLKTMTAKRELPMRPDRRSADTLPREMSRSYLFTLIILVCLVVTLIGGGTVLFFILQP